MDYDTLEFGLGARGVAFMTLREMAKSQPKKQSRKRKRGFLGMLRRAVKGK